MARLVRGKPHPSKEPLSPEDEQIVRDWVLLHANDPEPVRRMARTTAVLFRFGMHPIVLGQPEAYELKFIESPRILAYRRPKTWEAVRAPLRDEEAPWIGEFVDGCRRNTCTSQDINRVVHAAGDRMGMPDLTARGLRHDAASRALDRGGFNAARALTATTDRVLIGYARRTDGRRALQELTDRGF